MNHRKPTLLGRAPSSLPVSENDDAHRNALDKQGAGEEDLPLTAYALRTIGAPPIVPAPAGRVWMRETDKQFAHRCLPLLIANQAGWFILNDAPIRVTWDGGNALTSLKVEYPEGSPARPLATSMFGYGILTWHVDYLFRTPPGYDLIARGPTNMPKDGISPLDGIIETDWAVQNFTMNWKMTRPGHPVEFEVGEPFCMIVPHMSQELERFAPSMALLKEEPELYAKWKDFATRRQLMAGARAIARAKGGAEATSSVPYERHYFLGKTTQGEQAPNHKQKLKIRRFIPGGGAGSGSMP